MDPIPITNLTPDVAPPSDKAIRAIVTLSWPYSSSTKQCALLLADPDFRLRNRKGQVRARFTGASAEAVAKSHVGIGDEVVLSLEGASWEQDSEATRTPGRSVDGELLFRRRLALSVKRSNGNVDINVDAAVSPVRSPQKVAEIATPLPKSITSLQSTFDGVADGIPSYTYTSPAFAKRLRLSGESFLDSAYDPFAGDDAALESWNERKRSSFGSSLRWRYADRTPSPKKVQFQDTESDVQNPIVADEPRTASEVDPGSPSKSTRSTTKMLPPPLPHLDMPASKPMGDTMQSQQERTDDEPRAGPSTPEIRPVQSPTLPLPSPFPVETRSIQLGLTGRTAMPQNQIQLQDMTSETMTDAAQAALLDIEHAEDVDMPEPTLESQTKMLQDGVAEPHADVEAPQEVTIQGPSVFADDEAAQNQQDDIQIIGDSPEIVQLDQFVGEAEHADIEKLPAAALEPPRTPAKNTVLSHQLALAMDGASSAPPSAHVTPQSEKEKIMAQTYRSLFGFQDSAGATPKLVQSEARLEQTDSLKDKIWFSDIAKTRLDTVYAPSADARPQPAYEDVQEPHEPAQGDPLRESPEDVRPIPKLPSSQQPIEIVDLASSSESEAEPSKEEKTKRPAPQRRAPRLEIQDSTADSESEELLVQDSQALRGVAGVHERRRQASRLQEMVEEEPLQTSATYMAPREALEEDMLETEEADAVLAPEEGVVLEAAETEAPTLEPLLVGHSPPELFGSISSPNTGLPLLEAQSFGLPDLPQVTGELLDASNVEPPFSTQSGDEKVVPEPSVSMEPIEILSSPSQSEAHDVNGEVTETGTAAETIELQQDDPVSLSDDGELIPSKLQTHAIPKLPPPTVESPTEPMLAANRAEPTRLPDSTTQTASYPSLPLSPSNSQSLQDMPSEHADVTVQDTLSSVFPPTPQLTQSFTGVDVPTEELQADSQAEDIERLSQASMGQDSQPIPQLQDSMPVRKSPDTQLLTAEAPQLVSRLRKRRPARKSAPTRISDVPDIISPWFSPKRTSPSDSRRQSSDVRADGWFEGQAGNEADTTADLDFNVPTATETVLPKRIETSTNGFSTALSYFTSLSRVEEFLNPSSQQAYGTNTIDLIVLVTDRTAEPVRAKTGPRDYYTIFKVTDYSVSAQQNVRVEIYRPWLATLPIAMPGDVILLRAFAVKSRKRHPYLLSTDASAWCVWRNGVAASVEPDSTERPIWARKRSGSNGNVREEVKGPPVELGEEEREHAVRLRDWWKTVANGNFDLNETGDVSHSGLNGHGGEPIAAKL